MKFIEDRRPWIKVTVVASVSTSEHWGAVSIDDAGMRPDQPIVTQAHAICFDWRNRQERIFGAKYLDVIPTQVIWVDATGFWHLYKLTESEARP